MTARKRASKPEAFVQDIGVVGKPPTPLDATFFQQQAMKPETLNPQPQTLNPKP